jgi:hypothetical protein
MRHLSSAEARRFAEEWLPAWSGNRPEFLAGFYSDHAFYLDPSGFRFGTSELFPAVGTVRGAESRARLRKWSKVQHSSATS